MVVMGPPEPRNNHEGHVSASKWGTRSPETAPEGRRWGFGSPGAGTGPPQGAGPACAVTYFAATTSSMPISASSGSMPITM